MSKVCFFQCHIFSNRSANSAAEFHIELLLQRKQSWNSSSMEVIVQVPSRCFLSACITIQSLYFCLISRVNSRKQMCLIVEEHVLAVFQLLPVLIYSGAAYHRTSVHISWRLPLGTQMAVRLCIFSSEIEWVYFKLRCAHGSKNLLLRFLLDSS